MPRKNSARSRRRADDESASLAEAPLSTDEDVALDNSALKAEIKGFIDAFRERLLPANRPFDNVRPSFIPFGPVENYVYPPKSYPDGYLPPPPIALGVPFRMKKEKVQIVINEGYFPIWSPDLGQTHHSGHPISQIARALAVQCMIRLATEECEKDGYPRHWADIGGNTTQLRSAINALGAADSFASMHHLLPNLQAGDQCRWSERVLAASACRHMWQECTCIAHVTRFVMVHSLYYFHGRDLVRLMRPGDVLYAVTHNCWDAGNSLMDREINYIQVPGPGDEPMLSVRAKGNSYNYTHPVNTWLQAGSYSEGDAAIEIETVETVFKDLHLYRITRCEQSRIAPMVVDSAERSRLDDWVTALNRATTSIDPSALGPRNSSALTAISGKFIRIERTLWSMKFVVEGSVPHLVPHEVIDTLRSHCSGNRRDTQFFGVILSMAKSLMRKGATPASVAADAAFVAAISAFYQDVAWETGVLSHALTRNKTIVAAHAAALSGVPMAERPWYWRLQFWDWPGRLFHRCAPGSFLDCHVADFEVDDAELTSSRMTARFDPHVGPNAQTISRPISPPMQPKTLVPRPDPSLMATYVENSAFDPDEILPPMRLILLAVDNIVPRVPVLSAGSVRQSVTTRFCRANPPSQPAAWGVVSDKIFNANSVLNRWVTNLRGAITPSYQAHWLSKQRPKRQIQIARAGKILDAECPFGSPDMVKKYGMAWCQAFIKIERGDDWGDSRGIASISDFRFWLTGPFHTAWAEIERGLFGLDPSNYAVWVNGPNSDAVALGRHIRGMIDHFESNAAGLPVYYYFGDQSRFESHRTRDAWETWVRTSNACHPPARSLPALNIEKFHIVFRKFSVQFDLLHRLPSGGSETSIESGFRNICGVVHSFGEPGPDKYAAYFNGDDWLVITTMPVPEKHIATRMLQLGFETSIYRSIHTKDVEFCQVLLWPVGTTILPGPKIGRVLRRLPWQLGLEEDADVRGIALGMWATCRHIPFLRKYLARVIALSGPTRPVHSKYAIGIAPAYTPSGASLPLELQGRDPDAATWAFCLERYHCGPDEEDAFEVHLTNMQLGQALTWPGIRLFDRDHRDTEEDLLPPAEHMD